MTIDGVYYTEPELMAKFRQMQETIERLDSENYKLTEKVEEIGAAYNEQVSLVGWHEEREEKYKRLLKTAVGDINSLGQALKDNEITCESFNTCKECPFCSGDCASWRYADEADDLIGE